MSIEKYHWTSPTNFRAWLDNADNASIVKKWHTMNGVTFISKQAQPYAWAFWNWYYGKFTFSVTPTGTSPTSNDLYCWDDLNYDAQGFYGEAECTDCDIMFLKVDGQNKYFTVCANNEVTVILGKVILKSDRSAYRKLAYVYKSNVRAGNVDINSIVDTYITAKKTLGTGIADKYIAQPIVLGGVKTPLYSIVSNSTSATPDLFAEVVVDNQKFFIVDDNIGVKVD